MKIIDLHLKDFRAVADGGIKPQPSGVTIVVGPNEVGKSTLFEGFDLLLQELDSSAKREVKDSKPVGRDEGPSVEAEIEAGDYRFRVRKRWLRRPETELRVSRPRPEVRTGREAHERMREILESSVDLELFQAVRYMQGSTVGPPSLPTRGLLTEALDKASGGVTDTEESASLFDASLEEYRRYFTATGKELRATQDLRVQVGTLGTRVLELEGEEERVQEESDRHGRLSGELSALRQRLHSLEQDQRGWADRLQEVIGLEDRVKIATAEHLAAHERHARAVASVSARTELAREVAAGLEEVKGLTATHDAEAPELEKAKVHNRTAEERISKAEQRLETSERLATERKNDHELLRLRFDSRLLSERGRSAERALKDIQHAVETLARGGVKDEDLDELRELQTTLRVAQQKLEVASPTVSITALTDLRPIIDGETISLKKGDFHQARVPDSVTVEIPARARIDLKPGASLAKLQEGHTAARSSWESALAETDVHDLTEAVESNRLRNEAATKKRDAEKALRQALRTDEPEPFANLGELQAKLSELQLRMAKLERERPSGLPLPETRTLADRLAREAHQELATAQLELRAARDAAKRSRDELGKHQVREAELRSRRDQAAEMAHSREGLLEYERARTPDEKLARSSEEAREEMERKRESLDAVQADLRKADPEGVRARVKSLDAAVLKSKKEEAETQTSLTECSTRLEIAASRGFYDLLAAARRELDWKRAELDSTEKRARAAKLLFETITLRRDEAQHAYAGPLRDRIEEMGRLLHGPTFKVTLSNDLAIESRELDGLPIPFDSLSTGAREQLGIIMRLAAAMLVGRDGQGVPVVIDDALGFSDPERLKAMGAVIDHAGRECQILILTCYPERYGAVGSAEVVRFGS